MSLKSPRISAEIVIVMPVWRQAGLADEAIASVFAQRGGASWHLIIVNDGCPDGETANILESWRCKAPQKVSLLTQRNGGLAAARNVGIAYAVQSKTYKGIFFLDADNRLDDTAMQLFEKLLADHPDAGWFYPNFDMFGLDGPQSHGGTWSLSRMAISNVCDAGSLVRREVFDAGVCFAADMRHGYEDWDFWLSAAKLGFVGHAVSEAFFRYRKRGQSMLRAAHDDGLAMTQVLHNRHEWLFGTGRLAQIYAEEWPRFAFVNSDGGATIGGWPTGQSLGEQEVEKQFFAAELDAFSSHIPLTWVFGSPTAYDYLKRIRRLGSALLELEASVADGHIGAIWFASGVEIALRPRMRHVDKTWEGLANAALIAVPFSHLADAAAGADLLDCIKRLMSQGVVSPLEVQAPNAPEPNTDAVESAVAFVGRFAESDYRYVQRSAAQPWRKPAMLASPMDLASAVKSHNLGGLHLPGLTGDRPHIGFTLPLFRFGGVEKCTVALATALRELGATPHLFIFGDDGAQADSWLSDPFETVHQMTRGELRDWSGARYFGSADGRAPGQWLAGRLFGPLTQMDAVINAGCGPVNSVAGSLRRFGVKTATWEHLVEETGYGRPNGTPYVALSNEAAYDLVLTCSTGLADWLAGQSVARNKLLCLPNGPGFPTAQLQRSNRPNTAPLRVGFMGRLDHQKGVDRFVEVAAALRGPSFYFSLIGAEVLSDSTFEIPDWIARNDLARSPSELTAAYARLDVLLMPSRAEGLPLAVLEAQRAGVVPVVSDVGAVHEAISHEENGLLLPSDDVIPAAIAALKNLNDDRLFLHKLATAHSPLDRWADNARRLLSALGLTPLA